MILENQYWIKYLIEKQKYFGLFLEPTGWPRVKMDQNCDNGYIWYFNEKSSNAIFYQIDQAAEDYEVSTFIVSF